MFDKLSQHNNCTINDVVPYYELVDIISHSLMVAYPCYFEETMSVIAGISTVTGTPMVSSKHSALVETTRNSPYLIDVKFNNEPELKKYVSSIIYQSKFMSNVYNLYNNNTVWGNESTRLLSYIDSLSIVNCANKIINVINGDK